MQFRKREGLFVKFEGCAVQKLQKVQNPRFGSSSEPSEMFCSPLLAFGGVAVLVSVYVYFTRSKKAKFLKSDKKQSVTLIGRVDLTHDVRKFIFALPEGQCLGLPVGKYIFVSAEIDGKLVSRPYTPITSDDDVGFFHLCVKVYFPPRGGVMTQHLESLNIGDNVDIRGPIGRIEYKGHGSFFVTSTTGSETKKTTQIGMICGGSGITPCLQIIRDILKHSSDNTQIALLYANQTEQDILLKKELDECQAIYSKFLKVWYTVCFRTNNSKSALTCYCPVTRLFFIYIYIYFFV